MDCLHPFCPRGTGAPTWRTVVEHPAMRLTTLRAAELLAALNANFARPPVDPPVALGTPATGAPLNRLLHLCPCLFNQIDSPPTSRAVVHFCELTIGTQITAQTVQKAFLVQHPTQGPDYNPAPLRTGGHGGTIMELLCSEVLNNAGIPVMQLGADRWPEWTMPGHILLNEGGMRALKAFGDILIPCGPTNLVISVKSEAARERLLYSSNAIEGIGFGFFNDASEFWTTSRMALYKRMGFSAIYMPDTTYEAIVGRLDADGTRQHNVNVNGTDLYRPFSRFEDDMRRVVGRSSTLL